MRRAPSDLALVEALAEPAEMVAMFRDLKQLEKPDREMIRMLMEQMKKRKDQQG